MWENGRSTSEFGTPRWWKEPISLKAIPEQQRKMYHRSKALRTEQVGWSV
jgi:hypothetical protein